MPWGVGELSWLSRCSTYGDPAAYLPPLSFLSNSPLCPLLIKATRSTKTLNKFSMKQCKTMLWARCKGMAEEEEGDQRYLKIRIMIIKMLSFTCLQEEKVKINAFLLIFSA